MMAWCTSINIRVVAFYFLVTIANSVKKTTLSPEIESRTRATSESVEKTSQTYELTLSAGSTSSNSDKSYLLDV